MRGIMKAGSSFAAALIFSSAMVATSVYAEGETITEIGDKVKDEQVQTQLEQRNARDIQSESSSFTVQAVSTEVRYQQQIDDYQLHEYYFSTGGGSFTVDQLHQETGDVDYLIYSMDTDRVVNSVAGTAFELPEGSYILMVMGFSKQAVSYDYALKGPFSEQPDPDLPVLQVTQPTTSELRLPKGTPSKYAISGNAPDSVSLTLMHNTNEAVLNSGGTFSQSVYLTGGYNDITLTAMKESGNTVTSFYSVTLPGVTRIGGKDRYEVSGNVWDTMEGLGYSSGTVVIARGDMFPDALSGGPLATSEAAPVLLSATNFLPSFVKEKINEIKPYRAIILGGTGSISPNVETQLRSLGVTDIDRIGGSDRFAVSAGAAEKISDQYGSDTAIIASGLVFPDALSASTIAGPFGMPVLLVRPERIPGAIETYIKNHPEIKHYIIVGGPATVNDTVKTRIRQLRSDAFVERIGGRDRYEVAINVAQYGIDNYGMELNTLVFTRGDLFPDALSGGPLANYFMAPVLLTTTGKLESKVNSFLTNHSGEMDHIYIIGGSGSVSDTAKQQLYNHIK